MTNCKHAYNDETITNENEETCIFCGEARPTTTLNPPTFREHARRLATLSHMIWQSSSDEPLDGDQTEEFAMMFQEELDKLNGNT